MNLQGRYRAARAAKNRAEKKKNRMDKGKQRMDKRKTGSTLEKEKRMGK